MWVMLYQYYKELHPPTGVEHAAWAHFVSGGEWNLVVARTSLLEVYTLSAERRGRQTR